LIHLLLDIDLSEEENKHKTGSNNHGPRLTSRHVHLHQTTAQAPANNTLFVLRCVYRLQRLVVYFLEKELIQKQQHEQLLQKLRRDTHPQQPKDGPQDQTSRKGVTSLCTLGKLLHHSLQMLN